MLFRDQDQKSQKEFGKEFGNQQAVPPPVKILKRKQRLE